MNNNLLQIGSFTIHGYGLMIALGIIIAGIVAQYRARKRQLSTESALNLILCALVGGFAGAKLLFYLTILDQIIQDPSLLLNLSDGFVVYGGIIGGIAACAVYCRHSSISFLNYADLLLPSVALAQGFGRIGCLLAGCCYGIPTSSVFSITFQHSNLAPNGIALVPTQIISSFLDLLNFFALILIAQRVKKLGVTTAAYLVFYSMGRFTLEFFRGDLNRGIVGVLSTSQIISIFTLGAGLVLLQYTQRNHTPMQSGMM